MYDTTELIGILYTKIGFRYRKIGKISKILEMQNQITSL